MKASEVRERAFAMPLTSPAFPMGPYRFVDREEFWRKSSHLSEELFQLFVVRFQAFDPELFDEETNDLGHLETSEARKQDD